MSSVFIHPEDTWMSHLSKRSVNDLIYVDWCFALRNQNTAAVHAAFGRLYKCELTDDQHKRVCDLFKYADTFTAVNWVIVLRIFHLHDKNLGLAVKWVEHTPTVADKFKALTQNTSDRYMSDPEILLKNQALILLYTLQTPHITQLAQIMPLPDRDVLVDYIIAPLSAKWEPYHPSPWDAQTAASVSTTFPQYARAVFHNIAASACAFHQGNQWYDDPTLNRHQYHRKLLDHNNEGIDGAQLAFLALDSSKTLAHRQRDMIKGLEEIYNNADVSEQRFYLERLAQSPYAVVIKLSEVLESAAQKIRLQNDLPTDQDERVRKI